MYILKATEASRKVEIEEIQYKGWRVAGGFIFSTNQCATLNDSSGRYKGFSRPRLPNGKLPLIFNWFWVHAFTEQN